MPDEKLEVKAKIGFDLQDFIRTQSGAYVMQVLDQQIAITLSEMGLGKIQKGDKKGEFSCQTLAQFCQERGFALGIQWVVDFFKSRISEAKRIERDRVEKGKAESKT